MKTEQRDLNTIACDLDKLHVSIGLTQNYISCLQLQSKKVRTDNDKDLIIASLIHENGLDNIMETLNQLSGKIRLIANELSDYSEMMVTAND